MDFNIRKDILRKLNNATYDDLGQTIEEAINQGSETVLPGLGVFFEIIWKNGSASDRDYIITSLRNHLN